MRLLLASVMISLLLAGPAGATVIGHADIDGVPTLPLSTMDAIGELRWLFTHASVGANMLDGMAVLHSGDPGRYQLGSYTVGDWNQVYPPPTPTVPGTIYDGARGNPGWAAKFAMFDDAVRNLGWHQPAVDVAMDKLCYIDPDADVSVYLATMTALESDYPATRFVYMTMPIQSGANMDWSNLLAMNYNEAVRAHCAGPSRVLLDIADIESHDPSGNPITFTYEGQTYQRMWSGYTTDGGHLNSVGARRVALGWYGAGAAIVGGESGVPPLFAAGAGITAIAPNPSRGDTVIRFRLPRDSRVELSLFDLEGREVRRLMNARLARGDHAESWDGRDAAGRFLPAGVYFARLRSGELSSVRRVAFVP